MLSFIKRVFAEFGKDKAGQMSAAFAYAAVFSIGPLLLVAVSLVGFIYGEEAARGQLYDRLASAVGPDAARTLQDVVSHTNQTGAGVVALVFGIIGLLLGASGITAQLQNSFDSIFRAVPDPKAGMKFAIYTKSKNILVVIAGGLVALASVVLSAVINGAGKGIVTELLNNLVSIVVFIAILYLVYRVIPDVAIPRSLAIRTALVTSILFLIGKIILGFVIGRNGTASAYGAAASLVVLLLWFYYTAQILILGAEGIKVTAEKRKLTLPPKRFAVKLKELDIHAKRDLRGRLLEAFSQGYKSKTRR